jgi:hypothetical protein
MNYTTKQNLKTVFYILLYFIFGWACFSIGLHTKKTVYKTEKVLVSDEMNKCVQNGGQFSLFFSDFEEKYVINCEIPEKNIYREVIN